MSNNEQRQKNKDVEAKKPAVNLNDVKKQGRERNSRKPSASKEIVADIYQNVCSFHFHI